MPAFRAPIEGAIFGFVTGTIGCGAHTLMTHDGLITSWWQVPLHMPWGIVAGITIVSALFWVVAKKLGLEILGDLLWEILWQGLCAVIQAVGHLLHAVAHIFSAL